MPATKFVHALLDAIAAAGVMLPKAKALYDQEVLNATARMTQPLTTARQLRVEQACTEAADAAHRFHRSLLAGTVQPASGPAVPTVPTAPAARVPAPATRAAAGWLWTSAVPGRGSGKSRQGLPSWARSQERMTQR